jgi:hypothetical protein
MNINKEDVRNRLFNPHNPKLLNKKMMLVEMPDNSHFMDNVDFDDEEATE